MTKKSKKDMRGQLLLQDAKGRFLPGNKANPRGRPMTSKTLTGMLRQVACMSVNGKTNKKLLAEKLFELALDGSIPAIRLILEYLDGKPVPKVAGVIPSGLVDVSVREVVVSIPTPDKIEIPSGDIIDVEPIKYDFPQTTGDLTK